MTHFSPRAPTTCSSEGLIGLSLRPLAKAVGTSDRMLIYHFGSRAGLVAAIIDEATARSVDYLRGSAGRRGRCGPGCFGCGRPTWSPRCTPAT